MIARVIAAAVALTIATISVAQTPAALPRVVKLWPKGTPGCQPHCGEPEQAKDYWVKNIHDPTVTAFPAAPKHNNGAAIVVLPGGGHNEIVWTTEGINVAKALNRAGINAFVVKYRLAKAPGSTYTVHGDEAADVRRAMQWVRAHAADYNVDPHRIGLMGFSAGGELTGMLADYAMTGAPAGGDALDKVSPRPDFQVLVFPGPGAVRGAVRPDSPPAFLVAGSRDECCGPPTVALYQLLVKAGISAELHMYADSGHAFNLDESNRISILHWPDRLYDWMADSGFMDDPSQQRVIR